MYKKCKYCGKLYNQPKNSKMCRGCKTQYEIAFDKIKLNKALHEVMQNLANR